jgi:hypothetical protein
MAGIASIPANPGNTVQIPARCDLEIVTGLQV